MTIRLSSLKLLTGIFIVSLLVLFHTVSFCQHHLSGYSFGIFTKGINYTDQLFATSQNQQSFANREAAFYFEGDICLRQVAAKGESLFFAAAITASRYAITGANGSIFSDTSGLRQPFYISWSKGKIERLWFHNSTSASVSASIRMLMSYLQWQQPASGNNMLEAIEDDPNGHCNIRYTFYRQNNGVDSVVKEKKRYVQEDKEYDFNELKTTFTPEGSVSMILQGDYVFPVLVEGRDKVVTRLSQKIIGESETKFWIHKKAIVNGSFDAELLSKKVDTVSDYKPSSIYIYTSSREFRKNIRKDILGGDSLQLLVLKLHSSFADTERDSMVLKLKSLATVYPGMAYPLAAILDTAAARSKVYNIVCAALLDAETGNAVNALSALAWKHREQWDYTKGLITNIGLNPQVTDTVITFFKSLALYKPMSKTSRAAWMALGTMTDNISKQDKTAGQALWKWICDSLQILDAYADCTRIKLLVWGNSNQPAAFDSVTKFIKIENEELRSVAVLCIGQFSFTRKIPFLLDVIKSDTVLSIRSNAARVLSGQLEDSSHLLYVRKLMASEKDSSIRQSLLSTINIKGHEKKLVYEILRDSRNNDTSLTLRMEAADMLRRMED